jgi:hypothetical protein
MDIFKEANESHLYVGEASTAYLTDPSSAKNIYNFNPEAKIIIILRNPAERAYSLYNWMVQDGYEYASTFKKALELENVRRSKKIPNYWEPGYSWNYRYFSSGLYYEQVKRYTDLFGNNTLILKLDDLINYFDETYSRICKFLSIKPNVVNREVFNESRAVIHAQIQFILRKLTHRYVLFKKKINRGEITKKKERDALLKLGLRKTRPRRLEIKMKDQLMNRYRDDLRKLALLTKIDFNIWLE